MIFAKSYPLLAKSFAASALGLGLAGCVTSPTAPPGECMDVVKTALFYKSTYNNNCALGKVAETLSQSSDVGEKIVAQHLRETLDPKFKAASDQTRDEAVDKVAPYKVGGLEVKDGRKVIILVPKAEAPAPAAAPAATPAP